MDSKQTITILNKIIDTVFEHKGQIFGGYVRDVIVPLKLDPSNYNLQFKDIDIWFTTFEDRTNFISSMNKSLMPKNDYIASDNNIGYLSALISYLWNSISYKSTNDYVDYIQTPQYPSQSTDKLTGANFSREEYVLLIDNAPAITFDLIVCMVNPVNDSDINKLTIAARDENNEFVYISYCDLSVDEIIDLIVKRKYILREEYINYLRDHPKIIKAHSNRVENRLLKRGWDVYTHNGIRLSSPLPDNWIE